MQLKNFHIGINDMANDFLLYTAKSLKTTINIFNTNFLINMCDLGDVYKADRNNDWKI